MKNKRELDSMILHLEDERIQKELEEREKKEREDQEIKKL